MFPADQKRIEDGSSERKLWLDYLGKLKDREDRSNQVTGVTNWVLYGVIGTLLYKAIGFLPIAVVDRSYRYNTFLLIILSFNFLTLVRHAISELLPTVRRGESDIRALPERLQSLQLDYVAIFGFFTVFMGAIEIWVGFRNPNLPKIVRFSLICFGMLYVIAGLVIKAFFRMKRELDTLNEELLPNFKDARFRGSRAIGVIMLLGSGIAFTSIVFQLRGTIQTSSTWLLSVQSTFGIIVFFWAAYKIIILRPTRDQITGAISDLEQKALLENLSAEEIKNKFEKLTSGIQLQQWLSETSTSVAHTQSSIAKYFDAAVEEVNQLCSLPPSNDKIESLRLAKERLQRNITEYNKPYSIAAVQMGTTVAFNWAIGKMSSREAIGRLKQCSKDIQEVGSRLNLLSKQLDAETNRTVEQIETPIKRAMHQ